MGIHRTPAGANLGDNVRANGVLHIASQEFLAEMSKVAPEYPATINNNIHFVSIKYAAN